MHNNEDLLSNELPSKQTVNETSPVPANQRQDVLQETEYPNKKIKNEFKIGQGKFSNKRYSPYSTKDAHSNNPVICQSISSTQLTAKAQFSDYDDESGDLIRKSFSVPCQLDSKSEVKVAQNTMNAHAIFQLANLSDLTNSSGKLKEVNEDEANEKTGDNRETAKLGMSTKNMLKMQYLNYFAQLRKSKCLAHNDYRAKQIMSSKTSGSSSSRELLIAPELTKKQISLRHHISTYLRKHGFCVLDSFLGTKQSLLIKQNAEMLYQTGKFKSGSTLKNKTLVRGDSITWLEPHIQGCEGLTYFMKYVDTIVCSGSGMLQNEYNINGGTKAMVACYPGTGTGYRLHIDNPLKDGRCLTCIYYSNENWDSKVT